MVIRWTENHLPKRVTAQPSAVAIAGREEMTTETSTGEDTGTNHAKDTMKRGADPMDMIDVQNIISAEGVGT
jgi:hypothetical protein